ncbi:signal transduction histidine kinase [Crossiella equi]|uniref:histidine kinase n=1 Tax=Crossiella equi TaxID=130796 RepID=A0ABS5ATE9_9PSEU|nr:ATP-binding protein [Crossiella equi]MBP2479514.1 signal transduction histidine kinase [Crossiella equi]
MAAVTGAGELLRMGLVGESDVFLIRQRARQVAAAVGLDGQDQIRVATALSDVGRELVRQSVSATVTFRLRPAPDPALEVELVWLGAAVTDDGPGWHTARRLLDQVRLRSRSTTLVKSLGANGMTVRTEAVSALRTQLRRTGGGSALDELRAQNQELLETLENLEAKRLELERLNTELEETNQGVLALYQELSEELERTNQGVVALYAELDEKSGQLREAAEARTRFWANISHELRSPINSVVGLTRLLSAPGGDPLTPEQHRQVELIQDAGTTLLGLVNELLDTAKAESGSLVPEPVPVALEQVFALLCGTMQPVLRSGEVRLVVEPAPGLPTLRTDETILVRVLRNLLSNAVKFTERGEVRLAARPVPGGRRVRFVITDSGIGIPHEEQRKVFEDFYQVPNPLQAGAGGTGLGLPYARKLTELLGGELCLRSEPGVGTEVVVDLPLGSPEQVEPSAAGRTLIVDGDDGTRALLRTAAGALAGQVTEVGDGRSAVALAKEIRPELVFLGASTPLMSGSAVLSVLRSDPALAQVPVVVVCGEDPAGLARTVTGLGAALLPRSTIDPDTVRHAVREAQLAARRTGTP